MMASARLRRLCGLFVFAAAAIVLPSCASGPGKAVSGLFKGGDDKKDGDAPKEEDRISIIALDETLEPDPRYTGKEIDLPPAYENDSWATPGGEADHTLHHLEAPGKFDLAWKVDIGKASSKRARLTAPPVVADGVLYVVDADAEVSAIDTATGKLKWRTDLAPKIKEKKRLRDMLSRTKPSQIGFGGGVSYEDGKVFVTSGFGFVAGLNAEDGKELWRFQTDEPVRQPPTAYRGLVYFVTNTNVAIALSEETGEKVWEYQSFQESARILSSAAPAAAGDLVIEPFSSGEVVALLAGTGRSVWDQTLARNTQLTALASLNDIAGSPVIDRGLVYAVSHAGHMVAIDIRTGQPVWEIPAASLQMPWVAGDYIFIVTVDSELVCINRADGAIAWLAQLPRYKNAKKRKGRISWAGPVLAGDGLVLVSSEGEIIKASPQDGSIIAKKKLDEASDITPIVAGGKIFALTQSGKLYAFN